MPRISIKNVSEKTCFQSYYAKYERNTWQFHVCKKKEKKTLIVFDSTVYGRSVFD